MDRSHALAATFVLLLASPAWARQEAPALPHCTWRTSPHPFEVVQPDGARALLRARGAPWRLVLEDLEGYAVVQDGERYAYARREGGRLVPTALNVGRDDPAGAGLERGPIPAASSTGHGARQAPEPSPAGPAFRAASGTAKNLVLLLRFADHGPLGQNRSLPSAADVGVIMNQPGGDPTLAPTGSVRDHYEENSYGAFSIDSTVVGWLDVPGDEEDYADGISGLGPVVWDLITDGLDAADPLVDFSEFDEDGDGWIDAITFLHSGYGAEWVSTDQYGTPYQCRIWSHKWTIPTWTSAEGVRVGDYNVSPGLWGTSGSDPGRIGVVVHELGHFFGLPDLYDTDGSSQGIGNWDVMAGGAWGFDGSQRYPSHMSPWSKAKLGWLDPVTLRPGSHALQAVELAPEAYRIDDGYPPGEYLLIENRRAIGFDGVIPQEGLAIWHVDEAKGSFGQNDPNTDEGYPGQGGWPGNASHYRVALLQADGDFDMERGSNRGDGSDLFEAFSVSSIDGSTTPDLKGYQGGTIVTNQNAIGSISAPATTMSFTWSQSGGPAVGTTALAPGRVGAAYAASLAGSGGPLAWSEYREDPSYAVASLPAAAPAGGSAQGWSADDATWSLSFSFPFPFYETAYTEATVSSNGFLDFVPGESEPFNDSLYLRTSLRVAPLWDDLTTAVPGGDVLVQDTGSLVRVRWVGETQDGDPVDFAAVLHADGRIEFEYGPGNQNLTPTVGISRGLGSDLVLVAGHDGQADLGLAPRVELALQGSRLPRGLVLSEAGVLSGVPLEHGLFRPILRARDVSWRYDQREVLLWVAPRRFALDLSGSAQ